MLTAASYYKVRNLCKFLKNSHPRAIRQSANLLSKYVTSADTVIPMPSHGGKATYMLSVAKLMAQQTGCEVLDILSSTPHETWFNTKKQQGINADLGYSFNLDGSRKIQGKIYVIDNVCATGRTMKGAIAKIQEMYPKTAVEGLVVGLVDNETIKRLHYGPNLHEGRIRQIISETINRFLKTI